MEAECLSFAAPVEDGFAGHAAGEPEPQADESEAAEDACAQSLSKKGKEKPAGLAPAGKKNVSRCPGCAKWCEQASFPVGSRLCHPCKNLKDRFYKAAERHNQQEWLRKQLVSDTSTKRLFDYWRSQVKDDAGSQMPCLQDYN
eukprot:6181443-Amphidinium_carterae.1